jgi:hypothetical protein
VQLWADVGGSSQRTISAGVLGSDPDVTAFRVRGPIAGFAITQERAPGAVSPENPPVAQGSVDWRRHEAAAPPSLALGTLEC